MQDIDFESALRDGEIRLPQLEIEMIELGRSSDVDAVIDVRWRNKACRYVVEWKRDAKPLTLKRAVDQVRQFAERSGQGEPMLMAPYLSGEKIDRLLEQGISTIDLCGNAGIDAPGQFSYYRTGFPNQYPDSAPLRAAYRGDSYLVAAAMVLQREFKTVGDILDLIESRGGKLAISTVSKVLKRLEADLIIERPPGRAVRVIDPERLLDQLLANYRPPKSITTWLGKVDLDEQVLADRLKSTFGGRYIAKTGMGSATDYVTFAGERVLECYTQFPIDTVLAVLGDTKETRSFPNLRLIRTNEQRFYFDVRQNLVASPLQTWLEMASGDKRSREAAEPLRRQLLDYSGAING